MSLLLLACAACVDDEPRPGSTGGGGGRSSAGGGDEGFAGGAATGGSGSGGSTASGGGGQGGQGGGAAAGCPAEACIIDRINIPTVTPGRPVACQAAAFSSASNFRVYCWDGRVAQVTASGGALTVVPSPLLNAPPVADGRGDAHWVSDGQTLFRVSGSQLSPSTTCGATPFTALSLHSPAPGVLWAGGPMGAVCHYRSDGSAELFTLTIAPGVTLAAGVTAVFASDAGVLTGLSNGDIRRLDATSETTFNVEVSALHGVVPSTVYGASRFGVFRRDTAASWSPELLGDLVTEYRDVRVLAPDDVWATGHHGELMHRTSLGWTAVDPAVDLGVPPPRIVVLGVRGDTRELLLYGSVVGDAGVATDGTVVRLRRRGF